MAEETLLRRKNPYTPGAGRYPVCLAGRDPERTAFAKALRDIGDADAPECHVLYGPRGNGKTVLLADLCRRAAREGIRMLDLAGRPEGLIVGKAPAEGWLQKSRSRFRVGTSGTGVSGSMRTREWRRLFPPEALPELVAESSNGLLVTLDEAHAAPSGALGTLLSSAQMLRKDGRPLLLALAGTPGLKSALEKERATFWNRSKRLALGLLSAGACAEILEETGKVAGLAYRPEALETLVGAGDRYPYFVQLYGEAAWERAAAAGTDTVDGALAAGVIDDVRPVREEYYGDRELEIRRERLSLPARAVAEALVEREALPKRELEALLARYAAGEQEALALEERLYGLGLIWREPGERLWTAGIPSLPAFLKETLAPEGYPAEPVGG